MDNELGFVQDEDIGFVEEVQQNDDLGFVGDPVPDIQPVNIGPTPDDFEQLLKNEKERKAIQIQAARNKILAAQAQASDPRTWTLEKTQQHFKDNPPQTIQEEAFRDVLIKEKKDKINGIVDSLTGKGDQLIAAPEKNVFGKMKDKIVRTLGDIGIIESPEFRQAKSFNALALAKVNNLDPVEVEKNYEDYFFNPKYTGMLHTAKPEEILNAAMTPAVIAGLVTAPQVVIPTLAAFGILDVVLPVDKWIKQSNLTPEARSAVRLIDFAVKGMAAGGAGVKVSRLAESKIPGLKGYADFWHGIMGETPPEVKAPEVKAEKPVTPTQEAKPVEETQPVIVQASEPLESNVSIPKDKNEIIKGDLGLVNGRSVSVHEITGDTAKVVSAGGKEEIIPVKDIQKVVGEDVANLPEVVAARKRAMEIPETYTINTPQRNLMRDKLTNEFYGTGAQNKNRRVDIVLGPPAAGKGQVVDILAKEHGSMIIDNDLIKEKLPEYENGVGAAAVHKESADIIEPKIINMATWEGDNIVIPRLGKNATKIDTMIMEFKKDGYSVYLHRVDLPVEKAMQRTVNRFIERGRFVDPLYVKEVGLTPIKTFDILKLREEVSGYDVRSTDVQKGQSPKIIEDSSAVAHGERGLQRGRSTEGIERIPGENQPGRNTSELAQGQTASQTAEIDFPSSVEKSYDALKPEEQARLNLELDDIRKTPEGNLFVAIRKLGGISPYETTGTKTGTKFMAEELKSIPAFLKNKSSKHTLDTIVGELKDYGWTFEDSRDLMAAIQTQAQHPQQKVNRAELQRIIKEAEKNQKLQKSIEDSFKKRRKFIQTVKSADKTAPEVAQAIESKYTPIKNAETLKEAQDFVSSNYDDAVRLIEEPGTPTALSNAISIVMVDKAQAEGRYQDAIRWVEQTAEKQTSLGQAIQALSMYERLTPEGILQYAEKVMRQARRNVKQKERITYFERVSKTLKEQQDVDKLAEKLEIPHISEILAGELRRMAENIQTMPEGREKKIETAMMLKKISDQVPRSLGRKISMIQTIAQLWNPKTWIRNVLGNAGFMGVENIAESFATVLDMGVALKTHKRTVTLPVPGEQAKGFSQGLKEGTEEALKGVNLRDMGQRFDLPRNGVFDTGVLGALEKSLGVALRATDQAFYQAAYNQSLRQQTRLAGIEEPTAEMIERAHLEGLYRTFQDDNVISQLFVNLKRALNLNRDFGLGDIVLKYPKTPGNLLARGIEYSLFGFIKSIYLLGKPLVGYKFEQENFVRSTSRALTGSSLLVGTGAIMAQLGLISGKRPKDRDLQATQKAAGISEYQVNTSALKRFVSSGMDPDMAKMREDDVLVNYDWFLPSSIGLALGANMVLAPDNNLVDRTLNLADRVMEASETLAEQPVVRGVRVLTGKQNLSEGISDTFKDIPASFVPTLLNQVRQLTDNTSRNLKDPNFFEEVKKKVQYRIPGLSKNLPPVITTLGKEKEMYQMGSNNPFNVFLNPSFVSVYKPDPVSQMVLELYESTGETIQFPRVAQAKIKLGDKYPIELTPDKYTEFQKYIGTRTNILFSRLRDNEEFMNLDDELKAKKLQGYLTDIATAGKIEVLGYTPKHVLKDVGEIIKQIGINKKNIDSSNISIKIDEDIGFVPGE